MKTRGPKKIADRVQKIKPLKDSGDYFDMASEALFYEMLRQATNSKEGRSLSAREMKELIEAQRMIAAEIRLRAKDQALSNLTDEELIELLKAELKNGNG